MQRGFEDTGGALRAVRPSSGEVYDCKPDDQGVQKAGRLLVYDRAAEAAQEACDAQDDPVRQLAEELAQPRFLIARLRKGHKHTGVLVPGHDLCDGARRHPRRRVAAEHGVHRGELAVDRRPAYGGQQVEPGRVVVGEMALPQTGERSHAGLGESHVAVLAKRGHSGFDDLLPAVPHGQSLVGCPTNAATTSARQGLGKVCLGGSHRRLRGHYNAKRPHSALGWLSPIEFLTTTTEPVLEPLAGSAPALTAAEQRKVSSFGRP